MGSVTVLNMRNVGWNRVKSDRSFVYIGRGSVYGNPFPEGRCGNRTEVILKYGT